MSEQALETVDELGAFEESLRLADEDDSLPEIIGNRVIRKTKKDIVRFLWGGMDMAEACEQLGMPYFQAARWRNPSSKEYDVRFNMWCELYESENEQVRLAKISRNVYEKAEDDAKLGLQVLKARDPEKWNPGKGSESKGDTDERRRFLPRRAVINADFKVSNGK